MSAPRLIAQSCPAGLWSAPSTRLPTLVHFRATIAGASGAATLVADIDATSGDAGSTPGLTLTRSAAGIYDLTLPPCRQILMGTVNVNVLPNVVATVTEGRTVHIDKTDANSSAKLGKLRFLTMLTTGAGVATDPVDGSEIHGSFWADFG